MNSKLINKIRIVLESVIDPPHHGLSEYVFNRVDDTYRLKPDVRYKILRVWKQLSAVQQPDHVLIIGGISTFNYSQESDVDVNIIYTTIPESIVDTLNEFATKVSGAQYAGPHEINYVVKFGVDLTRYESAYDVLHDKWVKGPTKTVIDISDYIDQFGEIVEQIDMEKAELFRNLVDLELLKHYPKQDLMRARDQLLDKLDNINSSIRELTGAYSDIKNARNAAFDRPDPTAIKEYGKKNLLPENIVYLLLRKYYYLNFLEDLSKYHDVGLSDVEKIKQLFKAGYQGT